jgi:uncharacterized protein YwgA
MKDYWLAKLIRCVGAVDSRKRLQKSVYLLQLSGSPLACDYLLHYYGPYSFELASLIDQLNGAGIIEETPEPLPSGVVRYRSVVTPSGKQALDEFERTDKGHHLCAEIEPFIEQFKDLNGQDPWVLELAATVAFYHKGDWNEAQKQTASFKKVQQNDKKLRQAVELARRFKRSA